MIAGTATVSPDPRFDESPAPSRSRRVPLLIALLVLTLAAGAAVTWLALRPRGEPGPSDPTEAVSRFLTVVYQHEDLSGTEALVCAAAADRDALRGKLDELRAYDGRYRSPLYTWPTPRLVEQTEQTATLTVPITVTTDDDRVAEQRLRFVTVRDHGWRVCEITAE